MKTPSFGSVVGAIGRVTFREVIRDKILYNSVLVALGLVMVGLLGSKLTFTRTDRLFTDFGISAVSISCSFIAVLIGSMLLNREFDRRTIFVALAKPITRFQFLVGKYLGLAAVCAVNWAILSALVIALLLSVGGSVHPNLLWALALQLVQSLVMAGVAFLFSAFTTTSLAVIFSLGLFAIGNNVSRLQLLARKIENPLGANLIDWVSRGIPNLELFNLETKVVYELPLTALGTWGAIGYGLVWVAITLLIGKIFIERREA